MRWYIRSIPDEFMLPCDEFIHTIEKKEKRKNKKSNEYDEFMLPCDEFIHTIEKNKK